MTDQLGAWSALENVLEPSCPAAVSAAVYDAYYHELNSLKLSSCGLLSFDRPMFTFLLLVGIDTNIYNGLPPAQFSSMYDLINEPIDVLVKFSGKRVAPQLFHWNGREYPIKQVNLVHHTKEGTKRIFYFSVSDLTNYFKLRFDPEFLEWELVELYNDG